MMAEISEPVNNRFRPTTDIPEPYQEVFSQFPHFNIVQSKVYDTVFNTDKSIVISAPTGTGKTVVFELGIVKLIRTFESSDMKNFSAVYVCPMKALCDERLVDWNNKFSKFGLNCIAVTGDSDNVDVMNLCNHHIIITTPEKWDSITRKWKDYVKFVNLVKLFMVDEVQLLNEDARGSCLEIIICRMKTIRDFTNSNIRFMAVSASASNIQDVADWIDGSNAECFTFPADIRPVRTTTIVLGYSVSTNTMPFRFDIALNYKLQHLIKQYSHGKPTLIFCSTRKLTELTAQHIFRHLTIVLKREQKEILLNAASQVTDARIKDLLSFGVCFHHAGMLPETRRIIENLFRNGELPILATTSTLSTGVNLPAHLVIIKSTKFYSSTGFQDYSKTALMQMIGRSGRPQFDNESTALILTSLKDKQKFEKMIGGLDVLESNLHKHLIEHLNAEIVLKTITNFEAALRWLSSTFLCIRATKNPQYYGLSITLTPNQINQKLLELCKIEINKLVKINTIILDEDTNLIPTDLSMVMAKYYMSYESMKLFIQIQGDEMLPQILTLISKCSEFSLTQVRVNEKKCLNLLNNCRKSESIRFPLSGRINTVDMKINCLIQAVLGGLKISDHSILSDALNIMRQGDRIVHCLIEYLEPKSKCFNALRNTIILSKCFHTKLWENSPYVSKQLQGIGNVLSTYLVRAGKTTFQLVAETNPRDLELIINKKYPTGTKIIEEIQRIPQYKMEITSTDGNCIELTIVLKNPQALLKRSVVKPNSTIFLIVGDCNNNILLYEKLSHSYMAQSLQIKRVINLKTDEATTYEASWICEDFVGIDCNITFNEQGKCVENNHVNDTKKGKALSTKAAPKAKDGYMQKFMELYLKKQKNQSADTKPNIISNQTKKNNIIIHSNINIYNSNNINTIKSTEQVPTTENSSKQNVTLDTNIVLNYSPDNSNNFANLSKFRYLPKKLSHQTFDALKPDAEEENLRSEKIRSLKMKTVQWSSPLTYSPPVKFSPKLTYVNQGKNIQILGSTQMRFATPPKRNDLSPSLCSSLPSDDQTSTISAKSTICQGQNIAPKKLNWKLPTDNDKFQTNEQSAKTYVQKNYIFSIPSQRQSRYFKDKSQLPLTDRDYNILKTTVYSGQEKSTKLQENLTDFVVFESFGLLTDNRKENNLSEIKSPHQYYTEMSLQEQKTNKRLLDHLDNRNKKDNRDRLEIKDNCFEKRYKKDTNNKENDSKSFKIFSSRIVEKDVISTSKNECIERQSAKTEIENFIRRTQDISRISATETLNSTHYSDLMNIAENRKSGTQTGTTRINQKGDTDSTCETSHNMQLDNDTMMEPIKRADVFLQHETIRENQGQKRVPFRAISENEQRVNDEKRRNSIKYNVGTEYQHQQPFMKINHSEQKEDQARLEPFLRFNTPTQCGSLGESQRQISFTEVSQNEEENYVPLYERIDSSMEYEDLSMNQNNTTIYDFLSNQETNCVASDMATNNDNFMESANHALNMDYNSIFEDQYLRSPCHRNSQHFSQHCSSYVDYFNGENFQDFASIQPSSQRNHSPVDFYQERHFAARRYPPQRPYRRCECRSFSRNYYPQECHSYIPEQGNFLNYTASRSIRPCLNSRHPECHYNSTNIGIFNRSSSPNSSVFDFDDDKNYITNRYLSSTR